MSLDGGMSMETILQILFNSLEKGSIYALAALGIILIIRTSFTVNFAFGRIGMFTAFITVYFMNHILSSIWLGAVVGIISAIVIGLIVDMVVLRHAHKVDIIGKQIVTLGLIIIISGITPLLFGINPFHLPKFINYVGQSDSLTIMNASIEYNGLFTVGIGLIFMVCLFFFIQKTKWGLAVRATASNEPTARLMGVPTKIVTMSAWAIAGAFGALAAIMIAPSVNVKPDMMDSIQVIALIACVLGGFQTFYGPVIGAYLIAFSRNVFTYYISSVWGESLMYVLILLFIVFRPQGLIGKKIVKKV